MQYKQVIFYVGISSSFQGLATLDVYPPLMALARRGYDVHIFCKNDGEGIRSHVGDGNISIHPTIPTIKNSNRYLVNEALIYLTFPFTVIKLLMFTHKLRPVIILGTSELIVPALCMFLSLSVRAPWVLVHRETLFEIALMDSRHRAFLRFLIKILIRINYKLYQRANSSIAIDESIRLFMESRGIVVNEVIDLISVDFNELEYYSDKVGAKRSGSNMFIFYSGCTDPSRRLDVLFDAFILVKGKIPNIHLIIAGKQSYGTGHISRLISNITDGQIRDSIKFLGFIERANLIKVMGQATVCVDPYPKLAWTPSGKIREYMAMGKCCIASDVPSNRILFKGKRIGFLFESENPRHLADVLSVALLNTSKRNAIANRAKQYAKDHFDANLAAAKLEEYIRTALKRRNEHS